MEIVALEASLGRPGRECQAEPRRANEGRLDSDQIRIACGDHRSTASVGPQLLKGLSGAGTQAVGHARPRGEAERSPCPTQSAASLDVLAADTWREVPIRLIDLDVDPPPDGPVREALQL